MSIERGVFRQQPTTPIIILLIGSRKEIQGNRVVIDWKWSRNISSNKCGPIILTVISMHDRNDHGTIVPALSGVSACYPQLRNVKSKLSCTRMIMTIIDYTVVWIIMENKNNYVYTSVDFLNNILYLYYNYSIISCLEETRVEHDVKDCMCYDVPSRCSPLFYKEILYNNNYYNSVNIRLWKQVCFIWQEN